MKVVMIKAPNCAACKRMATIIDEKNISIEILDAYENAKLCLDNDITSVPTFLKIDETGAVVEKHSGAMTTPELMDFVL